MVKMGREAQHILPKNWGVKVSNITLDAATSYKLLHNAKLR